MTLSHLLKAAYNQHGTSLDEITHQSPTLVIFLRHFGCTFCREAASDISQQRKQIEREGTQIAFIHMGSDKDSDTFFAKYNLEDIHHIQDKSQKLYKAFELKQGSAKQLFGLQVMARGFTTSLINRHYVGKIAGDSLQMPGIFLLHEGKVQRSYRHKLASDRPDYTAFACPTPG